MHSMLVRIVPYWRVWVQTWVQIWVLGRNVMLSTEFGY